MDSIMSLRIRTFATAAVLLFAAWTDGVAQTATGRIVGTVVDRATGEPLIGGQVVVEERGLGNFTRDDGSFAIENVPAGVQQISSEYLGYQRVTERVRVGPGETVRVDFGLPSDHIATDAIVAVIEREPWSVPEAIVKEIALVPVPRDMPDLEQPRCSPRMINHGSYIEDGRWQPQVSIGEMECENYEIDPCGTRLREVQPPALGG